MSDGDESHSEFTFTGFVLAGFVSSMYWFHWFCYNTTKWWPFRTGGHRASLIFYNDASQTFHADASVWGTQLCSIIPNQWNQYMQETNQLKQIASFKKKTQRSGEFTCRRKNIQPIGNQYNIWDWPCAHCVKLYSIITKPRKPIHAGNEPIRHPTNRASL